MPKEMTRRWDLLFRPLLMLFLFASTLPSYACPELSGKYSCTVRFRRQTGYWIKIEDRVFEIQQRRAGDDFEFIIKEENTPPGSCHPNRICSRFLQTGAYLTDGNSHPGKYDGKSVCRFDEPKRHYFEILIPYVRSRDVYYVFRDRKNPENLVVEGNYYDPYSNAHDDILKYCRPIR